MLGHEGAVEVLWCAPDVTGLAQGDQPERRTFALPGPRLTAAAVDDPTVEAPVVTKKPPRKAATKAPARKRTTKA